MPRKTSDVPTRVYDYGAFYPTKNAAIVEDQLRLAHKYRNLLVEIERRRRARWEALVESVLPSATVIVYEERRAAVEGAVGALKRAKAGRGRRADVAGERDLLAVCKAQLAEIYPVVKEARARLRDAATEGTVKVDGRTERAPWVLSPLADAIRASDEAAHDERLAAREASGLRHGNYVRVEAAVDQAGRGPTPPHFTPYDGTGAVGTQLLATARSGGAMGLTVREALSGEDTRLRIIPYPHEPRPAHGVPVLGALDGRSREERLAAPPAGWMRDAPEAVRIARWAARPESERLGSSGRHQRRKAARMAVQIRVGSNPDRTPIFATFPIVLHRPLPPEDGVIKWAYVHRRRVGLEYYYRFQLTMEDESFHPPAQPVGHGTVAINLGWRNLPDGGIRVAYLVDDQGREEEIRVPARVMERRQKPDDLRSIRDRHLDVARAYLRAFLAGLDPVPAWLAERARGLAQWRATRKLAGLLATWRRARFDGDADIVAGLEAWAKKDRHLLAWESSQRDRTIGHRRMVYQRRAVDLARRYGTIVIAAMDLRAFTAAPAPEDGVPSDGKEQRATARVAAPGELREEIKRAQKKYGAALIERESAANLTQTCNACGHCPEEPWDAAPSVMHRCAACGETWDQDANHCKNLLATWHNASGPVIPGDGEVLDEDNGAGSLKDSEASPMAAGADSAE